MNHFEEMLNDLETGNQKILNLFRRLAKQDQTAEQLTNLATKVHLLANDDPELRVVAEILDILGFEE